MTHLTLTGYYAGRPLCDAARNPDEQYLHAAYAPIEKLTRNEIPNFQPLCPECLKVWNEPDTCDRCGNEDCICGESAFEEWAQE